MAKNKGYIRNNGQARNNVITKSKKGKYDLSIGLIVKNEEKFLDRCMQALLPLKEQISCEFIITDTGSTDGTIEIAKKYADKFIEFEWCNDFSKARNTGVNVAEGQWFMYVDADEIADSTCVAEIAKFIKSNNRDSYDNTSVRIKNYEDEVNGRVLNIIDAARMYNFTKGKRYFTKPVHETIAIGTNRCTINAHFDHYGYIKTIIDQKTVRNTELLSKIIEEDPHDIGALKHLMDLEKVVVERLKMCENALKIMKEEDIESDYYHSFMVEICRTLGYLGRVDEAEKVYNQYIEENHGHIVPVLEVYYVMADGYERAKNEDKSIECFKKYIEEYQYQQKKPDNIYSSLTGYEFTNERSYIVANMKVASYLARKDNTEEARKLVNDCNVIEYQTELGRYPFAVDVINVAGEICDGELAYKSYKKVRGLFGVDTDLYLMQCLNKAFYKIPNEDGKKVFAKGFAVDGDNDPMVALCSLRANDYKYSNCGQEVVEALKNQEELYASDIFIDAFYATLICNEDPLSFYTNCNRLQLEKMISGLFQFRDNFELKIYDWIREQDVEKLTNLIQISLFNYIVNVTLVKLVDRDDLTKDELVRLEIIFELYIKSTNMYTKAVYKDEVLVEEYMNALPPNQAFCYYVNEVISKKETEPSEYIAGLTKGVKYYPEMKNCVKFLADIIKKRIDQQEENAQQFQDLGKQIKQMLRMLIRQGNKEQALDVLEKYKQINPTDVDIKDLFEEIEKI